MEKPSSSSPSPTHSLSSLLCHEAETNCLEDVSEEDDPFLHSTDYYDPTSSASVSEDDDYIHIQLQREMMMIGSLATDPPKVESLRSMDDWAKQLRLGAINYILNTRARLGFQVQTAYLSILYLDRFLSKRSIDSGKSWAVQLLSVACLSLAAKLEECRVPILTEFQVGELDFDNKVIQRMELLVLDTLQWKMASVTALAYLPYFINEFSHHQLQPPSRGIIVSRTLHLIFAIAREINLMEHHPSAMACAAVLVAMDQRLPRKELESKINAIPLNRFIDIEDVFTCYSILQQLELGKTRMPKLLVSPELSSPINTTGTAVSQKTSATSSVSLKRKRLRFDDTDENLRICLPEKKRSYH
ncbi:hypothetical protein Dimus_004557 [Dionaea muscipula]